MMIGRYSLIPPQSQRETASSETENLTAGVGSLVFAQALMGRAMMMVLANGDIAVGWFGQVNGVLLMLPGVGESLTWGKG